MPKDSSCRKKNQFSNHKNNSGHNLENFATMENLPNSVPVDDRLIFEFVGIVLGDGNLYINYDSYQYQLDITLNPIDEPKYFIHVKNLMKELFSREVKKSEHKGKGASLRLYDKEVVEYLLDLGLQAGNKVKNQACVPERMLKYEFAIFLILKGLFDTDGDIEVDGPKNLRIAFTNCSKPLVEDFYKMCKMIGIIPSPKISHNLERKSWRVIIARKSEIRKFFEMIKPEKLKEPYRRKWLACKLIYLNTSENTQQKIEKEISLWLEYTNQTQFRYSKRNANFLKSICEKMLGIQINFDIINTTISKVSEYEKWIYCQNNVQMLEFLYEKLRSTYRIVEYLIDIGENTIPHRQTITRHIKRYLKETIQDVDSWLRRFPKMRIGVNNNSIGVFPNELRNFLNKLIINILKGHLNGISDIEVMQVLKRKFLDSKMILMNWLLRNPKYSKPIQKYLKNLIYVCRELDYLSENNLRLNITKLAEDPCIIFDRRTLTIMIDYLIDNGILHFE